MDTMLQEVSNGRLQLIKGDITRADLGHLFGNDTSARAKQKVVANLPFNITTDVLKRLLPLGDVVSELFLMLQVDLRNLLACAAPQFTCHAVEVLLKWDHLYFLRLQALLHTHPDSFSSAHHPRDI